MEEFCMFHISKTDVFTFLRESSYAFSCGRASTMWLFKLVSVEKDFFVALLRFLSCHSSAAVIGVLFFCQILLTM